MENIQKSSSDNEI